MSVHLSRTLPKDDPAEIDWIPEDDGVCTLCFNDNVPMKNRIVAACPLCHGTGRQTAGEVQLFKLARLL